MQELDFVTFSNFKCSLQLLKLEQISDLFTNNRQRSSTFNLETVLDNYTILLRRRHCQEAGLWMKLMLTIGTHKQPYVPIVKRSVSGVNHNN